MYFKKIAWTLFIFMLNAAAIAGQAVKANNFYTRGVYLDVNAGYAAMNWQDFNPTRNFTFNSNGRGGFTIGADTGYEYNRYFAFELGWYYLPQVKYRTLNSADFKVRSWFAYFGFKVSLPVSRQFYFFGKLAATYRYIKFISSPVGVPPDGRHSLWRPLGALGWRYYFGPNWSIVMQYMYLPGRKSSASGAVVSPAANIITLGYSYRFEV